MPVLRLPYPPPQLEGLVEFVRLGTPERIHPRIRKYRLEERIGDVSSVAELKAFYDSQNVVACTCLGVGHPIVQRRHFDYCIVDEASQMTQVIPPLPMHTSRCLYASPP